jgi:hypothetical protein
VATGVLSIVIVYELGKVKVVPEMFTTVPAGPVVGLTVITPAASAGATCISAESNAKVTATDTSVQTLFSFISLPLLFPGSGTRHSVFETHAEQKS